MSLAAHNIYDLESSIPKIIKRINFILHPNSKAADFIECLRVASDEQHGETHINLSFFVRGQILETQTAQSLTFKVSSTNFKELRRHPALAGVRIEAIDMKVLNDRRYAKKSYKNS